MARIVHGGERRELDITAEASLKIEADGKAVTAPVYNPAYWE